MPIYAYRCSACGHAKDVLQKISDPVLSTCPACHAETFSKQVTAAGFQLKGSGWYVTDFRGGASAGKAADTAATGTAEAPAANGGSSGSSSGSGGSEGIGSPGSSGSGDSSGVSGSGGDASAAASAASASSRACN
ncbi:MAG: zinc ribbon domain-containing protein [Betaproteobacteria bacterium]|nr:zinc ribbon domain-containing protein [Betaproteobacteria bacterium]